MLLEGKNAVVYGGGGAIGGAVARAFAREGARVFLAWRTRERLAEVATGIRAAGGEAETAVVDALDRAAVDAHADAVATHAGSIDVCLNVMIVASIEEQTMLGRAATLEDVGNVAAFVASDRARTMTAATANISCGALINR
jgi:3-oxoacyl-[acyl-carrier protein] reductase